MQKKKIELSIPGNDFKLMPFRNKSASCVLDPFLSRFSFSFHFTVEGHFKIFYCYFPFYSICCYCRRRSIWLAKRSIALLCTCLIVRIEWIFFDTHQDCLTSIGNDRHCVCVWQFTMLIKTTNSDGILSFVCWLCLFVWYIAERSTT